MAVGIVTGNRRHGQAGPAVHVHLVLHLHLPAAVVVDVGAVVLRHDPHGRGVVVDHEHAAATQRDEGEAAVAGGARTDRRVVRAQARVLAGRPARRGARGQVDRGRRLEGEDLPAVVRADALELLPVLVGDDQVTLIGGRPGGVRLGAHVDALDRLAGVGVEEDHVPAGHEGQRRVGVAAGAVVVAAVEDDHVRAHGDRSGPLLAHGAHGSGEVHRLRKGAGGVASELWAVEHVQRARAGVEPVFLVDQPHLVRASLVVVTVFGVVAGTGTGHHGSSRGAENGNQHHEKQTGLHRILLDGKNRDG